MTDPYKSFGSPKKGGPKTPGAGAPIEGKNKKIEEFKGKLNELTNLTKDSEYQGICESFKDFINVLEDSDLDEHIKKERLLGNLDKFIKYKIDHNLISVPKELKKILEKSEILWSELTKYYDESFPG